MTDTQHPSYDDSDLGEAFVRLFAQHHQRLLAYILAFTHDRADAEEVFQETSLVLWREFHTFRRDAPFMPWACGVALNQMRKFWRQRKRDRLTFSPALLEELASDAVDMEEHLERRRKALAECLKKLKPGDRSIVQLYYGAKNTAQDVADEVGKSVHTIYKALQRIRAVLLECINRQLRTGA